MKTRRKNLVGANLDKVFWPKEKYTKGDVISYYDKVSRLILPYLKDRPMVMNRHPNGLRDKGFFQKNVSTKNLPPYVKTKTVRAQSGKLVHYIVCSNVETLLYMANLGCIEMNPWASRARNPKRPDFFIADLDPESTPFANVIMVAQEARRVFTRLGLPALCKTSGKRGLHIYVPLSGEASFEDSRAFGKLLAERIHAALPAITSLEQYPARRRGKVHVDYMRNAFGQTAVAPYSLRPHPGATVSTPLEWYEVKKDLKPSQFTIKTIHARVKKKGDLWKPVLEKGADLRKALAKLGKMAATSSARP